MSQLDVGHEGPDLILLAQNTGWKVGEFKLGAKDRLV